jgi:YXWGXW repeat-containing protein
VIGVESACGHQDYIGLMHRHEKIRRGARWVGRVSRRLGAGALSLAVAAGTVQSGEICKSVDANGNVVYSDHLDPSMPGATAVQLDDPRFPPHELHFCWTNCFTLTLDHGIYRRADGTDESWTVETFTPQAIVLHRHDAPADWNGHSQDVVYAGQVANDRLIGVTVNGTPTSGIDASWGAALNTLPGSNAERDAPNTENSNTLPSAVVKSDSAPPPLQQDDQPALVEDGDLWTPGYWYWRNHAYVWISGAWVKPPQEGVLWTPAYWDRAGAVFVFHPGHWGSTVGFYGGVNYGYGYIGNGYTGGHWIGNSFAYNSAVNHVDPTAVHHTYAETVPNQGSRGVTSYASPRRTGAGGEPSTLHQPSPRAVVKPPAAVAQRTPDTAAVSAEVNKPATVPKTPTPSTPPRIIHVPPPTRAEPVKP